MLAESRRTFIKSHIKSICFISLEHRKLGIKAKMSFFRELSVLRLCS